VTLCRLLKPAKINHGPGGLYRLPVSVCPWWRFPPVYIGGPTTN